ncbi:MAG: GDP-mannose 4,6-dehydratase [Caldilineaceae bacterium]
MNASGMQSTGSRDEYTLVIGGAGFIGSNLAHRLLSQGKRVLVFDSLARAGVEQNLHWLRAQHGDRLLVQIADLCEPAAVSVAVCQATAVFHLGAQVAVTTSLTDPLHDFAVNAQGTVQILEALRTQGKQIPLVFTSTNKVYGALSDLALEATDTCYQPIDRQIRKSGISEKRNLAFHSPYGCSKGAADQYVLDYAHTFGLPATVFRMSCIYGPRQFGTEDQGWVAHFLRRALAGQAITIYGDGKQVRDILFVDDLINALLLAQTHIHKIAGEAFNIGGGPRNAISLLQLLELMQSLQDTPVRYTFEEWRPGDQRYYVSDTSKFQQMTGWRPRVEVQEGLQRLYRWIGEIETNATVKHRVGMPASSATDGCSNGATRQESNPNGTHARSKVGREPDKNGLARSVPVGIGQGKRGQAEQGQEEIVREGSVYVNEN